MTDTQHKRLRDLFAADYNALFRRLVRRLGSRDFTFEVLQESYLRIERLDDATVVKSPRDYFTRAALNVAKNRRKAGSKYARQTDIDELFDNPDDTPDPARAVEARSEVRVLKAALAELSKRGRIILNSIALEGCSTKDLRKRLKVSTRTVETDMKQALRHCATRLNRELPNRTGGPRPKI